MKQILTIVFSIFCLLGQAQEQFLLSLDDYQTVEDSGSSQTSQLRLPKSDAIVVMGGLNDLDGMGNYFNVFGSKLIVDTMKISSNGVYNLTLRREDGRDFYNLFPTLSAKLTPLTTEIQNELLEE
jgi:hypothetical protein